MGMSLAKEVSRWIRKNLGDLLPRPFKGDEIDVFSWTRKLLSEIHRRIFQSSCFFDGSLEEGQVMEMGNKIANCIPKN